MKCPKCGSADTFRRGGMRGGCKACRRTFNWVDEDAAQAVELARSGYAPEHDMTHTAAPGFAVKGTSTLYRDDGTVAQQWVKTTADAEMRLAAMVAACESLAADLPQLPPRRASGAWRTDLLTVYPIGDPHIGMYAWGDETGEDWDLGIAERVHCGAMAELVHAVPATERAIVLNLGDLFHYDGLAAVTPRSGHNLDADGRYAKMIDVGIKILRQCIESALTKHKTVHVMSLPGNHDESSALFLSVALRHIYEREPRVTIEASPALFQYFRWGQVLLGAHHGHTAKADKLPGIMATDRAKDWGETLHRHWLTGHIHHESKKELAGCTVESFNTLAGKDAYATNGGWRSGRSMQAVIYHREHGEVARSKVHAAMFEPAQAA